MERLELNSRLEVFMERLLMNSQITLSIELLWKYIYTHMHTHRGTCIHSEDGNHTGVSLSTDIPCHKPPNNMLHKLEAIIQRKLGDINNTAFISLHIQTDMHTP